VTAELQTSPAPANARHSERNATAYLAFLGILLAFGIDVALPAFDEIDADLNNGGASISLIGTLYFLGMAAGQVIYGPVADRFGRKPALIFGLTLYAAGALASALAPTFGFLLGARLVWGLGAAAPGALRTAIARDLFEGDQMARIVTTVTAVFMIGPIFVPLVGQLILTIAPWPTVFFAAMVLSVVAMAWTFWFGESLASQHQRPLRVRPLITAAGLVFRTRVTIGHILAQTFTGAAFFIFLGSSQPIIDRIYGREEQFVFFFGGGGVLMVVSLLINNRLIARYGARRMVRTVSTALVVFTTTGLAVTLLSEGRPSIWVWFAFIALSNAMITTITPMCSALALQPMGAMAGTASSILGVVTFAGGAVLAAIVDAQIDSTVTPMAIGYAGYALASAAALRWAADPGH
jgi:DHA1 family bicyclomycin/chloramphenicol resistance-like MFS transporter